MGESLLCPNCKHAALKWLNPDEEDLLEKGIMECGHCGSQVKGIPGWGKAMGIDQFKNTNEEV